MISSNTNTFRKLLPNHTDFLSVHIDQNSRKFFQNSYIPEFYYRILYSFHSSYKLILIFSESYYQAIYTFQSSYLPILILSKSYYPPIHIFYSSNKPLLTNKIIKTFSEFTSNNTKIFGELLQNNTDFFRVNVKQYTFSDKLYPKNLSDLGLFLLTGIIAPKTFSQSLLSIK